MTDPFDGLTGACRERWMPSTWAASGGRRLHLPDVADHPRGIFARYVLGTGSQWPEPIAILLMVVFTFVGAAASYRAGAHIAVALLTDQLPAVLKKPVGLLIQVLMVAICVFMLIWGTKLCCHVEPDHQRAAGCPWA
jgi:hypothetical protein